MTADRLLREDSRYSRQRAIPLFGDVAQASLAKSQLAVIGAGGVKSTMLLTLAAAGVGRIKIFDFDRVELSNLNRQVLYRTSDIGRFKAEAAAELLTALNPEISIEWVTAKLGPKNYDNFLLGSDLGSGPVKLLA